MTADIPTEGAGISGSTASRLLPSAVPTSVLDAVLAEQLVVAWAGEGGEEPRLAWWRSDLAAEFGGEDLFRRLLPATWRWAVLQGAREAAKRLDTELRRRDHDPDALITLFHHGYGIDEQLEQRMVELKTLGQDPHGALPGLAEVLQAPFERRGFFDWADGHGTARTTIVPTGRLLSGSPPADLPERMRRLVAALIPASDAYPLPHYRRDV